MIKTKTENISGAPRLPRRIKVPISRAKIEGEKLLPKSSQHVTPAPIWLVKRMKALQRLPPPTLQEVETSFRAAEAMRSKYEGNPSSSANGRKTRAT